MYRAFPRWTMDQVTVRTMYGSVLHVLRAKPVRFDCASNPIPCIKKTNDLCNFIKSSTFLHSSTYARKTQQTFLGRTWSQQYRISNRYLLFNACWEVNLPCPVNGKSQQIVTFGKMYKVLDNRKALCRANPMWAKCLRAAVGNQDGGNIHWGKRYAPYHAEQTVQCFVSVVHYRQYVMFVSDVEMHAGRYFHRWELHSN